MYLRVAYFKADRMKKYDAKRQRNRHSQSPVVPGANLKIGKKTLIFQGIAIFPVSHSSKMSPVCLPNFGGRQMGDISGSCYFLGHVV